MTQIGTTPGYGDSLESKTLPPPPPEGNLEVVVRTMQTDLALVQKSGGSIRTSSATTLSIDNTGKVMAAAVSTDTAPKKDRTQFVIWGIVFAVGTVVLFLLGFYFIPFLLSKITDEQAPASPQPAVSNTLPSQNTQPARTVEPVSFSHTSFFTTTPPPILDITLYENGLPPDRAGFIRNITAAVAARPDNIFLEVLPRGLENRPFAWGNLAALLGASAIDQTFFSDYMQRDYSVGMLRGSGTASSPSLQPVYVFKLKDNENPILLQRETLSLETDTAAFGKLFFSDPGTPIGTFKDIQVSGQPARALSFQNGPTLIYGWFFNTYLIIGTSEASLKGAIERL